MMPDILIMKIAPLLTQECYYVMKNKKPKIM